MTTTFSGNLLRDAATQRAYLQLADGTLLLLTTNLDCSEWSIRAAFNGLAGREGFVSLNGTLVTCGVGQALALAGDDPTKPH